MHETLINIDDMISDYDPENRLVIDCRYDLADSSAGRRAYLGSHISGAVYADLHEHLSGEPVTDRGRHPLPAANRLREVFSSFGIKKGRQVIAYDASSGAFAARLWWLLRYMGHEAVAVLNGGWQAWLAAGQPVEAGAKQPVPAVFNGEPRREWLVLMADVSAAPLLVDSREAARYRGEQEPIDAIAGHIPGAINRCWKENLAPDGFFLDSAELKAQFKQVYAATPPDETVYYCGSGVTACHNLLASAHAGLPPARLYAGSWSEWCMADGRAVETGSN